MRMRDVQAYANAIRRQLLNCEPDDPVQYAEIGFAPAIGLIGDLLTAMGRCEIVKG